MSDFILFEGTLLRRSAIDAIGQVLPVNPNDRPPAGFETGSNFCILVRGEKFLYLYRKKESAELVRSELVKTLANLAETPTIVGSSF